MKNIHIIPTDKPSRLFYLASNLHLEMGQLITPKDYQNIYITSDEEIKEDDWGLSKLNEKFYKKIILTTDQDLIKNGVQAIPDEFLEWFIKNPSCESVEVKQIFGIGRVYTAYEIILPKEEPKQTIQEYEQQGLEKYFEEPKQETENLKNFKKLVSDEVSPAMKDFIKEKQETLEEAYLNKLIDEANKEFTLDRKLAKKVAIKYANWQAEKMYSELSVRLLCHNILMKIDSNYNYNELEKILDKQFKKK